MRIAAHETDDSNRRAIPACDGHDFCLPDYERTYNLMQVSRYIEILKSLDKTSTFCLALQVAAHEADDSNRQAIPVCDGQDIYLPDYERTCNVVVCL